MIVLESLPYLFVACATPWHFLRSCVKDCSENDGPAQALPSGAACSEYHGNVASGKNAAESLWLALLY